MHDFFFRAVVRGCWFAYISLSTTLSEVAFKYVYTIIFWEVSYITPCPIYAVGRCVVGRFGCVCVFFLLFHEISCVFPSRPRILLLVRARTRLFDIDAIQSGIKETCRTSMKKKKKRTKNFTGKVKQHNLYVDARDFRQATSSIAAWLSARFFPRVCVNERMKQSPIWK